MEYPYMSLLERISQVSGKFTNLKHTERCCIFVDRIMPKRSVIVAKALDCWGNLFAVRNDMSKYIYIPVIVRRAAPRFTYTAQEILIQTARRQNINFHF